LERPTTFVVFAGCWIRAHDEKVIVPFEALMSYPRRQYGDVAGPEFDNPTFRASETNHCGTARDSKYLVN
jgi:hypothetical protein